MYGIAMALLLVAIVTLAIGFFQGGLALILVSVGASVGAGIFFVAELLRGRSAGRAPAWTPLGPDVGEADPSDSAEPVDEPGDRREGTPGG